VENGATLSENIIDPQRNRRQYIVSRYPAASPSVDLASIANELRAVTNVDVRVAGPHDHPNWLIVKMTPEQANQLKGRFSDRLIVEPDSTLIDPSAPYDVSRSPGRVEPE
jgi:hypothetical protein